MVCVFNYLSECTQRLISYPICMENLFPALHFQSVCVPCFEVGLLYLEESK